MTVDFIGGLFSKDARETVECLSRWTAPFVIDSARFEATFGSLSVTPHAVAVPTTLRWMSDQANRAIGSGNH
jgi:hypothetical protein